VPISAASSVETSIVFRRDDAPATTRTSARGTSRSVASHATSAAFARPPVGGAATRSFHASPWRPASSVRTAAGETMTVTRPTPLRSQAMAERAAVERELEEIGTQLAWVRDYL
jgi:hypothetical protein